MDINFNEVPKGILQVIEKEFPLLASLSEADVAVKRNRQNRTVKQLVGHMIDSASNNHQRMVRLQYNETLVFPDYTQDNDRWIAIQDYQKADWADLIQLWKYYNLHIAWLIERVDPSALENRWTDFEGSPVTLRQMIEGYLGHLHLHLDEIHELLEK